MAQGALEGEQLLVRSDYVAWRLPVVSIALCSGNHLVERRGKRSECLDLFRIATPDGFVQISVERRLDGVEEQREASSLAVRICQVLLTATIDPKWLVQVCSVHSSNHVIKNLPVNLLLHVNLLGCFVFHYLLKRRAKLQEQTVHHFF